MNTVTALEAKTRFGELLERVSRGEEIVITKHDKAVARIVPEGGPDLKNVRMGVTALRELQAEIRKRSKGNLSDDDVRSAIEEGRM